MNNFSLKATNTQNDVFVKKSVETLSDSKDKAFFAQFFKANSTTKLVGFAGQIVSAITEFKLAYDMLIETNKVLAVIFGLAIVALFEVVGVRIYLVSIVRQLVKKDFSNAAKVILLAFNVVFCVTLLLASFTFSLVGKNSMFTKASLKTDNTSEIVKSENATLNKKQALIIEYAKRDSVQNAQLQSELKSIENSYKNSINSLEKSKWTATNKDAINVKINALQSEKLAEKKALNALYAAKTDDTKKQLETLLNSIDKANSLQVSSIEKSDNTQLQIINIVNKFSSFFIIALMILSVIAIIYSEIYAFGSKQEIELKEVDVRPNLFFALMYGLYLKAYHLLYKIVVKIVGSQAYYYSKIMQTKQAFLSSQVSTNRLLNAAINEPKIGFQNSIKDCGTTQLNSFTDDKKTVLNKYKISTLQMQYKRSDLVENSLSSKVATQAENRAKYLVAKSELERIGVKFIEKKDNVIIKI